MNLRESFTTSLGDLAAHKLRSALTMLGVIFGVGAVIAMLSIGAGAERQAMEMIDRLGVRNVILRAKSFEDEDAREIREKSLGLSLRDAQAISDSVPGVEMVAPQTEIDPYAVVSAQGTAEAKVYGVSAEYLELTGLEIERGRWLDAYDQRDHTQAAVIGPAIGRQLFGYQPAIGADFKVNDVWLTVVGVLAAASSGEDSFEGVALTSTDSAVYVPVSTALRKFDRQPLDSPLSEIVVRLASDSPLPSPIAARVIRRLVDQLHAGADDFEMVVPEALLEQSRRTQRLFSLVMGSIAGISLIVGGIGIMNIMLATVLERTREIGVRRAVGAKRADILRQFLVESFTISALGGLCGIVMGLVIAWAVAAAAGWPTVVTPGAIVLATGVAVTVGILSGIYPARRAAELDPIEALRYE